LDDRFPLLRSDQSHDHFFGRVPIPLRPIELGELSALLPIVSVPPPGPTAAGLKVTLTEHLPLGRSAAPHPFTIAKSPLATMLEKVTGVVLLLF
jgi:hypothetical protein